MEFSEVILHYFKDGDSNINPVSKYTIMYKDSMKNVVLIPVQVFLEDLRGKSLKMQYHFSDS